MVSGLSSFSGRIVTEVALLGVVGADLASTSEDDWGTLGLASGPGAGRGPGPIERTFSASRSQSRLALNQKLQEEFFVYKWLSVCIIGLNIKSAC